MVDVTFGSKSGSRFVDSNQSGSLHEEQDVLIPPAVPPTRVFVAQVRGGGTHVDEEMETARLWCGSTHRPPALDRTLTGYYRTLRKMLCGPVIVRGHTREADCAVSIAATTADLLIEAIHVFRYTRMHDSAHIPFVD